ncbi:MAG: transglutaminase domain-containing protein [Anaerolineaceae bacterium]|nr:transglutaminase domain-containing protein [Anaerolineaceae bacterium]
MKKAQTRWLDIPSVFLLLGALWLSANRLSRTKWTTQLDKVELVLLIGLILGFSLGYSIFPKKVVRWMVLAYGGFVMSWQLSLIGDMELYWAERQFDIISRLWHSIVLFFQNQPINDPLLFLLLMIGIYWIIGVSSGYFLMRSGKPWIPLLVSAFALLIYEIYPPFVEGRHLITFVFTLLCILLMWRVFFYSSNLHWHENSSMVDYGIGFDISKIVVPLTILMVGIAWLIPYFGQVITPGTEAQQKFQEFWAPARERFSNVVSGLNAPRANRVEYYGNSLALGTEISNNEETVFYVTPKNFHPAGTKYYWRGYSYDRYENGFWVNTINDQRLLDPEDWSSENELENLFATVEFNFDFVVTRSTIVYTPGVPTYVGTEVNYQGEFVENGDAYNGIVITSQKEIKSGDQLRVEALVAVPTIEDLRNDGTDYPEWVLETYLDLPDSLPESIPELAEQISEGLENPYDIVDSITNYLRDQITYSREIDPIPKGQDPIEWFLFETQSGYCNYYASSEVILLRSLGIPARMSVGFAEGDFEQETRQFEVSLDDSHAWPEVYFPTFGWIEFEPTASQPIPLRPSGIEEIEEEINSDFEGSLQRQFGGQLLGEEGRFEQYLEPGIEELGGELPEILEPEILQDPENKRKNTIRIIISVIISILCLLIFLIWREVKVRQQKLPVMVEDYFTKRGFRLPYFIELWAKRSELSQIEKDFSEVSWMLYLLGIKQVVGFTPHEQVKQLNQMLPDGIPDANMLLEEYELSIYSPRGGNLDKVQRARKRLWKLVFKTKLRVRITGRKK